MRRQPTFPQIPEKQLDSLRSASKRSLHLWYRQNAREMPWRNTKDAYAIWVSEAMLQQTQVATVIPYYQRWMERFPTLASLADAAEREVLVYWEGLGYYSRARNLHRAAKEVVERFGGKIPAEPAAFGELPGVGPYTVAAVQSIAFAQPLAVLDGNVKRVLARLIALDLPVNGRVEKELRKVAQQVLVGSPAEHNQAMMELGAKVCLPRHPACDSCPFSSVCQARALGEPERYPRRVKRKAVPHRELVVAVVKHRGRLLLNQRPYGGLLAGLWDLPAVDLLKQTKPAQAVIGMLRRDFDLEAKLTGSLSPVKHVYSHFKVTLHPYCYDVATVRGQRAAEGRTWRWIAPAQLGDYALPKTAHKILAQLAP